MESRILSEELSSDGVEIVSIGYEKKTSMVKGIVLGASAVAAGWLATCLYKKFKKPKSEETEPEVVVVK